MNFESLIIWIIVGAIAGIVLDTVMGGMRIGLVGAILIGVLGAIISGWAFQSFGVQILSGIIGTAIEALVGAVILLLIFGVIRRF
jgi:uncharacterized membrane protein YeaQ/YmgE (transglycosylase-associated protein family)